MDQGSRHLHDVGNHTEREQPIGTARKRILSQLEGLMRTAATMITGLALAHGTLAQERPPRTLPYYQPPPMACSCEKPEEFLIRGCISSQTKWVKSDKWTLEMKLWMETWAMVFVPLKKEEIQAEGITIKDCKIEGHGISFVLVPKLDDKQASIEFPILCYGAPISLKLKFDLTNPPQANKGVSVKIVK